MPVEDTKRLDPFTASQIAEGNIKAESAEQEIEAWQVLIDTGLAWKLQGWFGRRAIWLIRSGVCTPTPVPDAKEATDD